MWEVPGGVWGVPGGAVQGESRGAVWEVPGGVWGVPGGAAQRSSRPWLSAMTSSALPACPCFMKISLARTGCGRSHLPESAGARTTPSAGRHGALTRVRGVRTFGHVPVHGCCSHL
ncbi:hypothetical protein FLW53_16680 [Microbispora sp. SCL1-1]|nr:hypothetical protein FLW53_16680 [Microbispora sp. SCL1-1]